jgi:hypothetical protein
MHETHTKPRAAEGTLAALREQVAESKDRAEGDPSADEVAKAKGPKPLLTTYERAAIRKRMAELRWQVAQAYDEIHRLAEEIKQDRINEKAASMVFKEAT